MDDNYVAQVLAKEAKDSSQKYSAEGISAYLPRKTAGNAPKPNLRFLRHLIKETDNHNTALKRKEERDSNTRMRELKEQSPTYRSTSLLKDSSRPRASEKSRREDRDDRHRSSRRHRSRSRSTDRDRSRRHRHREDDKDRTQETDRDRERRRDRHRHESRKDRRDRDRSYSRSRSRSPRKERTSRSHRERHRSASPSRRKSRSHRTPRDPDSSAGHDDKTSRQREFSLNRRHKSPSSSTVRPIESDNESDPLEDIVGPLPPKEKPVRSRGRGAYKANASTIDSHFASDYDPTLDIQPDDDESIKKPSRRAVSGLMTAEDDWEISMEAQRERESYRMRSEARLRTAGFDEKVINKYKAQSLSSTVSVEPQPEDVRWSKKGEGREWDRGKFVDDNGQIDVRAAWS
ncbi:hypothetical protein N7490_011691 [Penicillium lividum]|nr:hypothetical protein N7490_011691 [Penicillium lividum]